jgi:hypothetical protein
MKTLILRSGESGLSKDEATMGPHGSRRRKRLLTMRIDAGPGIERETADEFR